jgi:methionyl-tRNA formyltransferase
MKKMNILFLGERRIAEACIRLLFHSDFAEQISLKVVVSNEMFYKNMIREVMPEEPILFISNSARNTNLIANAIRDSEIEALISVQHGWILEEEILNAVKGKAFNLHNAKLPDLKGYNAISHALIGNHKEYVSTVHWMDADVDTGDIIIEGKTDILYHDTALSLYKKTVLTAVSSFRDFLVLFLADMIPRRPIHKGGMFHKKNELDSMKSLDYSDPYEHVLRVARACCFPPYEPAYFKVNGIKCYLIPDLKDFRCWQETVPFNLSDWENIP